MKKENRKKAINFIKKHGTDDFFQLFIKNLVAENNQLLIPKNLVHVIKNTPKNSIINGMKAMMNRPDRKHILPLINYPILFIIGEKDEHYPKHEIFNQASICKLAQVNVIENSGHLSMMENEKDFLDALQQFVLFSEAVNASHDI
jgi:pimeloyl-ACP methyl ester carboxylesterase